MGNTNYYTIPYPEQHDIPDGAGQMKSLADRVDEVLKPIDTRVGVIETRTNIPTVQVRQNVAQSLPNGGGAIIFDAEDLDTHGMHSNSTNPTRLTATVAGWYLVWGSVSFAAGTTGRRGSQWMVSGAVNSNFLAAPMPTSITQLNAPTIICRLNIGDYVELIAYQDSGAALSTYVGAAGNKPWAGAQWILPY